MQTGHVSRGSTLRLGGTGHVTVVPPCVRPRRRRLQHGRLRVRHSQHHPELRTGLPVKEVEQLVARLRLRWLRLPEDARRQLAARWIDVSVKTALPHHALETIVDEASMLRVEVALSRLLKTTPADETRLFALLGHFEALKGELVIDDAAFMALETSRALLTRLEADLPG